MIDAFNFLYDFQQNQYTEMADRAAAQAKSRVAETQSDLRMLQRDHERLKLVVMALWTLLKKKTKLTDEELMRHVVEVDMTDGVRDG